MAWGVRWRGGGGTSWCHKWAVAQVGGTERCWCTTSGVQSKIEEAPPGGGTSLVAQVGGASGGASWWWQTSVGAQILGCKATLWMHHPVVAQVVAQVGGGASLAQVGGGASLAQVGLVAQVWRKFRLLI